MQGMHNGIHPDVIHAFKVEKILKKKIKKSFLSEHKLNTVSTFHFTKKIGQHHHDFTETISPYPS